ncbi:MAG: hypothetical protein ACRERE_32210 [Candidatus Entotheonellia bacterium]
MQLGVDVASNGRVGGEFASQGGVIDASKAFGNVRLQDPCRFLVDLDRDGADRIPAVVRGDLPDS